MQRPRNAESFSSLYLISYSAWHHDSANSGKSDATRDRCISPMRPIDTVAFLWRLLGALGWSRMGIRRESSKRTHCWNSGSSDRTSSTHQSRTQSIRQLTTTVAQCDLADGLRRVIACVDEFHLRLWIKLRYKLLHDRREVWSEQGEAVCRRVAVSPTGAYSD